MKASQISPVFLLSHLWMFLQGELDLRFCEMSLQLHHHTSCKNKTLSPTTKKQISVGLQTWQSSRQIRFSFTIRPITGVAFPEKHNFQ